MNVPVDYDDNIECGKINPRILPREKNQEIVNNQSATLICHRSVLEESSSGALKKGARELKRAQAPGGTKITQGPGGTKVSWADVTRESRQPSTSSKTSRQVDWQLIKPSAMLTTLIP